MPRIQLVNPNTSSATTAMMVEMACRSVPHGWVVEGVTARRGASLIVDAEALALAAEAVLELVPGLNADGVIVSAFGDPGASELAERLGCPVIGIGEASIRAAAQQNRRFSIVTTTPQLVSAIRQRVTALGFAAQLASIRVTRHDPTALTADEVALETALGELVEACRDEDAASAVIVGGGPLARAAAAIAKRTEIAVIEPVPAAVQWLVGRLSAL
ncbi:MAG: hypothetical protein RL291_241 [Pseudomonadota bacterium]